MADLLFKNSRGERRIIGQASNREQVFEIINKFLEDHNYKSYYTRIYEAGEEWCIDVGSHTEFFYISTKINLIAESKSDN